MQWTRVPYTSHLYDEIFAGESRKKENTRKQSRKSRKRAKQQFGDQIDRIIRDRRPVNERVWKRFVELGLPALWLQTYEEPVSCPSTELEPSLFLEMLGLDEAPNGKTVLEYDAEAKREAQRHGYRKRVDLWPKLKIREGYRLHQTLKAVATPPWADRRKIGAIYRRCRAMNAAAGYKAYNVDHIIPLINERICGLHVPENLQIIPARDNAAKGNRF